MATVVIVSICKYSVHMVDLRLDNGWPGKSVCLFYIDLIHDVVSMTLFLVFMLTFFVQNPSRLPIYMMADVIQVARKLAQRLKSFRKYRRISQNMEGRFPDATDEEIEQNEHCVICRESLFEASRPKRLPCGHIFHIDCIRSWLVMQQVCPTCRAEIPADGPMLAAPEAAPEAAPAPEAPVAQPAQEQLMQPASPQVPVQQGAQAEVLSAETPKTSQSLQGVPIVSAQPMPQSASTDGSPDSAITHEAAKSERLPQSVSMPSGGAISPSIREITDALKQAEEVAKFLREQTAFWMDQVRVIEKAHASPGVLAHVAMPDENRGELCPSRTEGHLDRSDRPSGTEGDNPGFEDQMSKIRRAQSQQWEKRRSSDLLGESEG